MEYENTPIIFANGMNFKAVSPNAPETVRGSIYFKWNDFKQFGDKHVDERGYLNVKMMKSKEKGTIYFILDSFKPNQPTEETKAYHEQKYRTQELSPKQQSEVEIGDKLYSNGISDEDLAAMSHMEF
jgi:hypothetical protein